MTPGEHLGGNLNAP